MSVTTTLNQQLCWMRLFIYKHWCYWESRSVNVWRLCQREATIKELQQQYNRATDEQQQRAFKWHSESTVEIQTRLYEGAVSVKKIWRQGQKIDGVFITNSNLCSCLFLQFQVIALQFPNKTKLDLIMQQSSFFFLAFGTWRVLILDCG